MSCSPPRLSPRRISAPYNASVRTPDQPAARSALSLPRSDCRSHGRLCGIVVPGLPLRCTAREPVSRPVWAFVRFHAPSLPSGRHFSRGLVTRRVLPFESSPARTPVNRFLPAMDDRRRRCGSLDNGSPRPAQACLFREPLGTSPMLLRAPAFRQRCCADFSAALCLCEMSALRTAHVGKTVDKARLAQSVRVWIGRRNCAIAACTQNRSVRVCEEIRGTRLRRFVSVTFHVAGPECPRISSQTLTVAARKQRRDEPRT